MIKIRLAIKEDAAEILNIYSPYIENTSLTFETEVPSLEQFTERIVNNLLNWPWLVCEVDGRITGYAYATRHRERVAYQWSVESSVYIHENFQKKGIAHALYLTLIEILKKQGFRNVYAVINLPNDKSVSFHEKCGFEYFTTFEKVGYKLGAWKNVGWWKLSLNEYGKEPAPPTSFTVIDRNFLKNLFAEKALLITDK